MEEKFSLPKITTAMLVLTHECQLRCSYCFVCKNPQHMTLDTARKAVDMLIANAEETGEIPMLNYFGGEPTLMWNQIVVPLTDWIRNEYAKPFALGITTNGTLLNDDRLRYLKQNDVGILFSMDGAKTTQDYNRPLRNGGSTFDILQEIAPKVSTLFPKSTFRMTAIPATCQYTFENICFAEDNGFRHFFIVPNVFEEWSDSAKRSLEKEMRKYSEHYMASFRDCRRVISFAALERAFHDIKMINYAVDNDICRTFDRCVSRGKCGLGTTKAVSIHPNGNLYACQEMTSNAGSDNMFCIGNLETGVDDDRRWNLASHYNEKTMRGADCSECLLNRICDGGCVANNYMLYGDVNIQSTTQCWWKQLLVKEAIYIMQTLGAEENQWFKEKWRAI